MIIESDATDIAYYTFSLPGGETLIALWTDGVAVEEDPGISASIIIPGHSGRLAVGIDVLVGFEQLLTTRDNDGDLVIPNLVVRDYPIVVQLSDGGTS